MSDTNIHQLMHLLCLRAGKKVQFNEWNDHWINDGVSGIAICLLCDKSIINDPVSISDYLKLRDEHAFQHLKEYNLLPFI